MKALPPAVTRRRFAPGLLATSRIMSRATVLLWASFAATASSTFAASTDAALPEHVFTDWQGHTLQAGITDVSGPDVYLQHGDEMPFKVKISVFSKDDQAYIHDWSLSHPEVNTAKVFRITALLSRPTQPTNPPVHSFKILLTNISGKPQGSYRIQYVLFRLSMPGIPGHLAPERQNGEVLFDALPPDGGALVETSQMSGTVLQLAVWVRIYDDAGTLVQEWKSSPALAHLSWDVSSGAANSSPQAPAAPTPPGGDAGAPKSTGE